MDVFRLDNPVIPEFIPDIPVQLAIPEPIPVLPEWSPDIPYEAVDIPIEGLIPEIPGCDKDEGAIGWEGREVAGYDELDAKVFFDVVDYGRNKRRKKNSEYLQHECVNSKLATNKTTKISHICIQYRCSGRFWYRWVYHKAHRVLHINLEFCRFHQKLPIGQR